MVNSKLFLRCHAAWHSSLPRFQQNGLMNLNVNNCIKGTQRLFVFNQLSSGFPKITMKFWTTEVQSVILDFLKVHVAWSGVSILGLSCLDLLSI